MKPLVQQLLRLATYRRVMNLRTIPVVESYGVMMGALDDVRRRDPVHQANLYAWFWAVSAHRLPLWRFSLVAAGMYQHFLPLLRLNPTPLGTDVFVAGSSLVIEQIGIPQLSLLLSDGSEKERDDLLRLVAKNELQNKAAPILRSLTLGDLPAAFEASVRLEQEVTLEQAIYQSPLIRLAAPVVGRCFSAPRLGGTVPIVDLTRYALLDKAERVRLGFDIAAAIHARPTSELLGYLEGAAEEQERIIDTIEPRSVDLVRPAMPSALPYEDARLPQTVGELERLLSS